MHSLVLVKQKKHSLGHDIMKTPFERHVGTIGMSNAKDPDGKQPKKRQLLAVLLAYSYQTFP